MGGSSHCLMQTKINDEDIEGLEQVLAEQQKAGQPLGVLGGGKPTAAFVAPFRRRVRK